MWSCAVGNQLIYVLPPRSLQRSRSLCIVSIEPDTPQDLHAHASDLRVFRDQSTFAEKTVAEKKKTGQHHKTSCLSDFHARFSERISINFGRRKCQNIRSERASVVPRHEKGSLGIWIRFGLQISKLHHNHHDSTDSAEPFVWMGVWGG